MTQKRGRPRVSRVDQIIRREMAQERRGKETRWAAAKRVADLLNNSNGMYITDDAAAEISRRMIKASDAGKSSADLIEFGKALHKNELQKRRRWTQRSVYTQYYELMRSDPRR